MNLYANKDTGQLYAAKQDPGDPWIFVGHIAYMNLEGSFILNGQEKERVHGEYVLVNEQLDKLGVPRVEDGERLSLWGRILTLKDQGKA